MTPTVLLFDIDGTLLTTGGAGRRALRRAFHALHGRADACEFPLDGMTDRRIARLGLEAVGVPASDAQVDAVLAAYVAHLGEEVQRAAEDAYRVLPGMREAVAAALDRPRTAVGLGTGNIREGARVKLGRVGLYAPFRFGGFGCDHEDRPTLIRMGAERGAALLGERLEDCRVVIIGDTPKDVAAAQAMGAECLAVATGSYGEQALRAAGATFTFSGMDAGGALPALLGG
jgi:phosphoglycolate phosphatase